VTSEGWVAGIFIGGAARRMGGTAKGLLVGSDRQTLIAHWQMLFHALGLPVVLVGASDAYRDLGIPMLDDEPAGVGPIGGLIALLQHAGQTSSVDGRAIAVACDMPWVNQHLLQRLMHEQPEASLLAARHRDQWQPFLARYDAKAVLPVAKHCLAQGQRALHRVLTTAGAKVLELSDEEARLLRDWDTAQDVTRDGGPWS
jgi:molybdopterin-guanine dinucleotide biosynthesis protein A